MNYRPTWTKIFVSTPLLPQQTAGEADLVLRRMVNLTGFPITKLFLPLSHVTLMCNYLMEMSEILPG